MSRSMPTFVNAASIRLPHESRMLDPRHAIQRLREVFPDRSLAHERAAPAGRQTVVSAPPLPGFLHPASLDHALRFEAIECRIERGDVERDRSVGSLFDLLADLVAVAFPLFEERQDEQFRATPLQLPLEHR